MINLQSEQARSRLMKAVKTSREAWYPFRQTHKKLIEDHVGSWYGTTINKSGNIIVNLLNQTAKIYTVALAFNNPRVMVNTSNVANWSFAKHFEVNLNKLISDMQLDRTFRLIVLDAFYSVGAACVMMRDTDTRYHGLLESEEDVWLDPGEPWLNRISSDDLVLDMSAREVSKMRFCGHIYRADYRKVMEERGYNGKVRNKLVATSKHSVDNPEFARDIAGGQRVDDDELKPMLYLMDLWVPENNSIATFAHGTELPPLIEREWTGGQGGPYKFLSFGDVPDNVVPVSPAMNLKNLHDLQNRLHRRMLDDSRQHRKINVYNKGAKDDANRLKKAKNGEWVWVEDPDLIRQVELGGISPLDQSFSIFVQEQYDRFAGNLRAMGGLGAEAATLGQEEIVQGNVSRMEAAMQMAVVKFAEECVRDLGYLMWNDQFLSVQSSREIGNTGLRIDSSWEPGYRQGDFNEYDFPVEPYSMVFKTPHQKLAELFSVLERVAPLWPMLQAGGIALDGRELINIIADLTNRPELKRILTSINAGGPLGGDQNTIRQSPVTSRETIRRSVPSGGTPEARNNILQQVLSGMSRPQVSAQQAQMVGRPA